MDISGKLKYVGIELMRKDATSTDLPETGLFRGVRIRSDGDAYLKLVLLGKADTPNDITALNMEVFNVMTLLFVYGDNKEMVVFRNDETDQEQATELMEAIVAQLKTDKLMLKNDPEIVDVDKFVEVPNEFFAPKKTTTNQTKPGGYTAPHTVANNTTTDWQKKQEEKKVEEERQEEARWTPFILARKGEKPVLKDLNLIKKKVQQLAAGDYERELPNPDPEEEPEKDKKEDKKTLATG